MQHKQGFLLTESQLKAVLAHPLAARSRWPIPAGSLPAGWPFATRLLTVYYLFATRQPFAHPFPARRLAVTRTRPLAAR